MFTVGEVLAFYETKHPRRAQMTRHDEQRLRLASNFYYHDPHPLVNSATLGYCREAPESAAEVRIDSGREALRGLRAAGSARSLEADGGRPATRLRPARGTVAERDLVLLFYNQIRASNSVVAASSGRKRMSSRAWAKFKDTILMFRTRA